MSELLAQESVAASTICPKEFVGVRRGRGTGWVGGGMGALQFRSEIVGQMVQESAHGRVESEVVFN